MAHLKASLTSHNLTVAYPAKPGPHTHRLSWLEMVHSPLRFSGGPPRRLQCPLCCLLDVVVRFLCASAPVNNIYNASRDAITCLIKSKSLPVTQLHSHHSISYTLYTQSMRPSIPILSNTDALAAVHTPQESRPIVIANDLPHVSMVHRRRLSAFPDLRS